MEPYIKLSDLTARIEATLRRDFKDQTFWVVAETTNLSFYEKNAHYYFELIEKNAFSKQLNASIKTSAWGPAIVRIRAFETLTGQPFANNLQLLVQVAVEYHAAFGLRLLLKDVDPSFTLGKIESMRIETLKRLLEKNADAITLMDGQYLTRNKRLPLPHVIQKIAVISSSNSAGFTDFMHSLTENAFFYTFTIDTYFTLVQGEGMDIQMVQKLLEVHERAPSYDAVVIIRGGGSQTDFLWFDAYNLARAVARYPIPIITGIGHHKNETITDLMANVATKTPTQAAEFIISHNKKFEDQYRNAWNHIALQANILMGYHRQRVTRLQSMGLFASKTLVDQYQGALTGAVSALVTRSRWFLENKKNALSLLAVQIGYNDPRHILNKGYALIYMEDKLLTDTEKIAVGSKLTTLLKNRRIESTVTAIPQVYEQ